MNWILCLLILFLFQVHAEEEKSLSDRLKLLEQQRGYHFKKRRFHAVADAELLYWKATVEGAAYAVTAKGSPSFKTSIQEHSPDFSYNAGFRLGVGIESPFDLFDVIVIWTRFYTQGKGKTHASGNQFILSDMNLIKPLISSPQTASCDCFIQANLIDLQLARGIKASNYFFMRPYFGIRSIWLDVDWNMKMDRSFSMSGLLDQDATKLKIQNDFVAGGGLLGLDLEWRFGKYFGISGRLAGALVYGLSQENTQQKYLFMPAGTQTMSKQRYQAQNSAHTMKGLWEMFAGAFWEKNFLNKKPSSFQVLPEKQIRNLSLRIFAGYEFQQWYLIAQKTIHSLSQQSERYSLGFEGFTGGATLVF